MRIVELTAFHVRLPLRKPVRHASHERQATDNIVVRCRLDDGTTGYGEGVPRDYVTGETVDSALRLLRESDWRAQLEPCQDFSKAVALAERLELPAIAGDERGIGGNAARCALELSVLDAYGRRFGTPLAVVTQQLAPELFEPRDRVRYSGAITSANGFKARLAAWRMRIYGFQQVKVKVGIAGQDDVARLRIIRRRVGAATDLRVDANEAWSAAQAAHRIGELAPFGITAVEQPVAHKDVDALADIRRRVRVPIMLDESLCSLKDAEQAVERGRCDLFNLRLSKCGGFTRSLRLAQFAERHGLGYQLGCQIGESAILSAAGRHFACTVRGIRYVEGSYDRHLMREALGTRDLTFGWGGWAKALSGPGLGMEVDAPALEHVTIRKETLLD